MSTRRFNNVGFWIQIQLYMIFFILSFLIFYSFKYQFELSLLVHYMSLFGIQHQNLSV